MFQSLIFQPTSTNQYLSPLQCEVLAWTFLLLWRNWTSLIQQNELKHSLAPKELKIFFEFFFRTWTTTTTSRLVFHRSEPRNKNWMNQSFKHFHQPMQHRLMKFNLGYVISQIHFEFSGCFFLSTNSVTWIWSRCSTISYTWPKNSNKIGHTPEIPLYMTQRHGWVEMYLVALSIMHAQ